MIVQDDATFGVIDVEQAVKDLYRQALRYHIASYQDQNILIAARHNGYAAALSEALHNALSEEEFQKLMGKSLRAFRAEILQMQDALEGQLFKIMEECCKRGVPGLL